MPLTTSSIWETEVSDGFLIHELNQDFFLHKFGINAESVWYIADLGVAAQYRHLGLRTKLMQTAIAYKKPVLLRVSLVRERAIALYERLGFEDTNLFQKANYQQQNGEIKTFDKIFMFLN